MAAADRQRSSTPEDVADLGVSAQEAATLLGELSSAIGHNANSLRLSDMELSRFRSVLSQQAQALGTLTRSIGGRPTANASSSPSALIKSQSDLATAMTRLATITVRLQQQQQRQIQLQQTQLARSVSASILTPAPAAFASAGPRRQQQVSSSSVSLATSARQQFAQTLTGSAMPVRVLNWPGAMLARPGSIGGQQMPPQSVANLLPQINVSPNIIVQPTPVVIQQQVAGGNATPVAPSSRSPRRQGGGGSGSPRPSPQTAAMERAEGMLLHADKEEMRAKHEQERREEQQKEQQRRQAAAREISARLATLRDIGGSTKGVSGAKGGDKSREEMVRKVATWIDDKVIPTSPDDRVPNVPQHSDPSGRIREAAVEFHQERGSERNRQQQAEEDVRRRDAERANEMRRREDEFKRRVVAGSTPPGSGHAVAVSFLTGGGGDGGNQPTAGDLLARAAASPRPSTPADLLLRAAGSSQGYPTTPGGQQQLPTLGSVAARQASGDGGGVGGGGNGSPGRGRGGANGGVQRVFVVNWPPALTRWNGSNSSGGGGIASLLSPGGNADVGGLPAWEIAHRGGQFAGGMARTGAQGIMGVAGAADPFSTMPTFQGSVEALSIQVGKGFLPVIDQMSSGLQTAAKWVKGLDSGMKENIARMAAYGVIGLGTAAVLVKVGAAATTATTSVIAFGGAMTRIAMAHPIIAGLTLAVSGAAAAYMLLGRNARDAASSMSAAGSVRGPGLPGTTSGGKEKPEGLVKGADFDTLPLSDREKLSAAAKRGHAPFSEELGRVAKEKEEAFAKAKLGSMADRSAKTEPEQQKAFLEILARHRSESRKDIVSAQSVTSSRDSSDKEKEDARAKIAQIVAARTAKVMEEVRTVGIRSPDDVQGFVSGSIRNARSATPDWGTPGLPRFGSIDAAKAKQFEKAEREFKIIEEMRMKLGPSSATPGRPDDAMARSLAGLPPPRIVDPASLGEQIQIAALKGGDLDAQNKAEQLEALRKSNQLLEKVHDVLNRINVNTGTPVWR